MLDTSLKFSPLKKNRRKMRKMLYRDSHMLAKYIFLMQTNEVPMSVIPPYKIFLLNFKINKISEAKSFCIHIGFTREIFLRCFIKMMILKINHDLVFEIITWSNKKCYKSHLTKFFCIKNIQYYKKK